MTKKDLQQLIKDGDLVPVAKAGKQFYRMITPCKNYYVSLDIAYLVEQACELQLQQYIDFEMKEWEKLVNRNEKLIGKQTTIDLLSKPLYKLLEHELIPVEIFPEARLENFDISIGSFFEKHMPPSCSLNWEGCFKLRPQLKEMSIKKILHDILDSENKLEVEAKAKWALCVDKHFLGMLYCLKFTVLKGQKITADEIDSATLLKVFPSTLKKNFDEFLALKKLQFLRGELKQQPDGTKKLTGPQIALLYYMKGERASLYIIENCKKARDKYNPGYRVPRIIYNSFTELVAYTPGKTKTNNHISIDQRIADLKAIQPYLTKKQVKLANDFVDKLELTRKALRQKD